MSITMKLWLTCLILALMLGIIALVLKKQRHIKTANVVLVAASFPVVYGIIYAITSIIFMIWGVQ